MTKGSNGDNLQKTGNATLENCARGVGGLFDRTVSSKYPPVSKGWQDWRCKDPLKIQSQLGLVLVLTSLGKGTSKSSLEPVAGKLTPMC